MGLTTAQRYCAACDTKHTQYEKKTQNTQLNTLMKKQIYAHSAKALKEDRSQMNLCTVKRAQ